MSGNSTQSASVVQRPARPSFLTGDGGSSPTPALHKADWRVVKWPPPDVKHLVRLLHYSRSVANTCVASHGLISTHGVLSGGALWMPGTKAAAVSVCRDGEDWRGVLHLSRLVVAPEVPKNGASFLLAHSRRMIDRRRWPILVTYADTAQGHTGAIYLADGWEFDRETPAGDVWRGPNGELRGRKRGPRNMTEDEMRAAGFERMPSFPKLRFTHRIERRTR